ncbi:MAG: response regulator [Candidatus Aminicenantes bacterium]|nr:MAG: response regulator [Candidatus Aminicenantes bacterium]
MEAKKILVVEDEILVALDIKNKVIRLGYEVVDIVAAGEAAIEKVNETHMDLILMDISLAGDIDGIEAAKRIQSHFDIPIIYLTAHSDKDTLERAKLTGPYGFIVKPFDKRSLHAAIEMALYKHQMEAKLREKEENFRNLAENASDGILMTTVDGSHVFANQRATELTGYNASQLQNLYFNEFISPGKNRKESEEWLKESIFPQKREITIEREEQRTTILEMTGTKTIWHGQPAVLVLLRDITRLKRAEEERNRLLAYLEEARKMEALGTLAGGIAHDFNNLLSIIMGFTELIIADLTGESPYHTRLEKVLQACLRAKDLVKQILTFSRPGDTDLKPVKLSSIIQESLKHLRSSIPANIDIQLDIKAGSDTVLADPMQINQVLINFCDNAVYAMREAGGVLEVILEELELTRTDAVSIYDLKPGHFVRLTMRDTGKGMEPAVMKRIFEPYFTSKSVGEGSGLGLAVVHGIVKNHGGAITVQSSPGKGSTFQVYLPKTRKKIITDKIIAISGLIPKGHERILFVDDEEAVVDLVKNMLEYLGYQVVTKTSGFEALERFKSEPDQFEMIITDMIMPKMTGAELAKEILKIKPGIPIIICTGYSEKNCVEAVTSINIKGIIKKPLVMRQLAHTIRNALEDKNS